MIEAELCERVASLRQARPVLFVECARKLRCEMLKCGRKAEARRNLDALRLSANFDAHARRRRDACRWRRLDKLGHRLLSIVAPAFVYRDELCAYRFLCCKIDVL